LTSSSEKTEAFRQRLASGGYLRREVLVTQAVAQRVADLAKEHKVSTVDVTSALLEQGLARFDAMTSSGVAVHQIGRALAPSGSGEAGAASHKGVLSAGSNPSDPSSWRSAMAAELTASLSATPQDALRSQVFASQTGQLTGGSSST
jgi:hypothetical protein